MQMGVAERDIQPNRNTERKNADPQHEVWEDIVMTVLT